jgi:hypothetical protein
MEQGVRELEAFAAVVYSSNFDLHAPGFGTEAAGTAATRVPPSRKTAPSVSPSPSPAAQVINTDVSSIIEVSEEDLQEVPTVPLQINEEPDLSLVDVQETQEEENEKPMVEIPPTEEKEEETKEETAEATPVAEKETADAADSGFEEVWGKASSGAAAEPSPSS